MSVTRWCEQCGQPLPPRAPGGLCPKCLLAQAVAAPLEPAGQEEKAVNRPAAAPEIANRQSPIANRFGDYELLNKIAEGGMGVVYRARQLSLNRIVAVKMIQPARVGSAEMVLRFRAEAEAAASLHHPNIVPIHETGECEGQHYFSMDFIEGKNLAEAVREGPLPSARAAQLVEKIAAAVHHAHQHKILHRDLKPSNVLLDEAGGPHVTDFGLARKLSGESTLTLTGQVFGSPRFMPPEQASGRPGAVGVHSDVYGLGAILYYLLTARPPFVGETVETTLAQVLQKDPVSPRLLNASIPRDLETICLKCLEKESARRYASAQAVADELGRFLRKEPISARPVGFAGKAWRWCQRKPALAAAMGALVLVIAVGFAAVLWQWQRAERQRVRAEDSELFARQNAYAADMLLAQHALADSDVGLALGLLNKHRPGFGVPASAGSRPRSSFDGPDRLKAGLQTDLRHWEWRYLWQLCQPDQSVRLQTKSVPTGQAFISQDGRVLAVRTGSDKIEVWDLTSKRLLKEMPGFDSTTVLGLSPTGSLLAVHRGEARTLEVWDVNAGKLSATLDHPVLPRSLAFSPDGRLLATFDHHSSNAIVSVMDWAANRTLTNLTALPPRRGVAGVVTFSPDANRLAVGEDGAGIRVVRWPSGSVVPIQTQTTDGVTALAFSPDSKLLAAGFQYTSGTIRLWDADSGEPRGQLTNHTGWVRALAFSPDGRRLASASVDQTIRIWSVVDQTELRRWQGQDDVWASSFLPDGRTLVSGADEGSVCFWDIHAGSRASGPIKIAISRDPTRVAASLVNRFGIAFTPDSRSFVTTDTNGSLAVWDARTMQQTESLPALGTNHWGVALSPDGHWLAAGDVAGKIHIWDWRARRRVITLEIPFEWCGFLRFSRSGSFLWTWVWLNDHRGTARMWRTGDWQEVPLATAQQAGILSLALSPDERHLATGHTDGWLKLWSFPAGQPEATFRHGKGWVFGLRFSGDGRVLVSTSPSGTVRLWDAVARRELDRLPGHLGGAWGVALSPDGRRLATGGGDTQGGRARDAVKLWDLATHRELLTLPGEGQFFTDLTFSPDGNTLVGTCLSGTAHFWRAPTWEEIAAAEKGAVAP